MAKPKSIDEIIEQVRELEKSFETVTETEVPTSLKAAIDERWQLAANGLEVAYLLHYPEDEYEPDSRRVLALDKALLLIDEYEDEMIRKNVRSPSNVLWSKIVFLNELRNAVAAGIVVLWNVVEAVVKEAFAEGGIIGVITNIIEILEKIVEALIEVAGRVVSHFMHLLLAGLTLESLSAAVADIMRERDKVEERMRKKAFPQAVGPRYRRRKEARL